jgi:hypothetical protein
LKVLLVLGIEPPADKVKHTYLQLPQGERMKAAPGMPKGLLFGMGVEKTRELPRSLQWQLTVQ